MFSTPRANPFAKGTNPICRLPLLTFDSIWPEADNLGDLLRILVRISLGASSLLM